MPTWDYIEDASHSPARVWLSRENEEDEWKPLRKADCKRLNSQQGKKVLVEGGRAMADPQEGTLTFNYFNLPVRELLPATWFVREEKSAKEVLLRPLSVQDADLVEDLYQRAVAATSSLGKGIDPLLKEELELMDDDKYRVVIMKNAANVLTMKKKPKGWFGTVYDLQRGYGEYKIEGEDEEESLGPVRHLCFVIHGIGEAMFSRTDNKIPSMIEECHKTRSTIQRRQVAAWKKACDKAKKAGEPPPVPPNRIELIPIEWYDHIHSSSNSLMKSLKATTLQTIPALRAIANDVVFDVLMYLTPTFCQSVLETVTDQIDTLWNRYIDLNPGFLPNGGKTCLIGHSLGSVICWDLLSILKDFSSLSCGEMNSGVEVKLGDMCGVSVASDDQSPTGYQAYATQDEEADVAKNGSWGPSLIRKINKSIPFVPDVTIFLGSPIGMFLTLRGAHAVFEEFRQLAIYEAQKKVADMAVEMENTEEEVQTVDLPVSSPFSLPSGAVYNIFHPSDPVAYRIEPLLLPPDTPDGDIPPPLWLVKPGQSLRLHVKALQLGDGLRRSFAAQTAGWSSMIAQVTEQAASVLSYAAEVDDATKKKARVTLQPGPLAFELGGRNKRVDYQLQTGVIDNEYLSAVSAHSNYFSNIDFLDFLIDLAQPKEQVAAEVSSPVALPGPQGEMNLVPATAGYVP